MLPVWRAKLLLKRRSRVLQRLPFEFPCQPIGACSPAELSARLRWNPTGIGGIEAPDEAIHGDKSASRPPAQEKENIRQESHPIDLPNSQSNRRNLQSNVRQLDRPQPRVGPLIVEPSKRRANGGECLERGHKQHGGHHDAEDLQGVAGHVHHDGVHGDGFRGSDGEFPGLFEEEVIGFDGGWGDVRFAARFLSGWLADCGDVRKARGGAGGGGNNGGREDERRRRSKGNGRELTLLPAP